MREHSRNESLVPISGEQAAAAARYSAVHRGIGLVIRQRGRVIHEDYPNGGSPDQLNPLASGTKSFCGPLAVAAVADQLLDLDAPVAHTITEWQSQPERSLITLRQLLQLTSGLGGGGKPGRVPTYEESLQTPLVTTPGRRFFYGSAPFQVFGELLHRCLGSYCEDPLIYLQTRLLNPIGIQIQRWRRTHDRMPSLPTGATLTAREWALFGELICRQGQWEGKQIVPRELLAECFQGSRDNPAYGLTWWLNAPVSEEHRKRLRQARMGLEDLHSDPLIPRDLVYAAGAAKQRLYVSPSHQLVVVRQASGVTEALAGGEVSAFSDREFLTCLFGTTD